MCLWFIRNEEIKRLLKIFFMAGGELPFPSNFRARFFIRIFAFLQLLMKKKKKNVGVVCHAAIKVTLPIYDVLFRFCWRGHFRKVNGKVSGWANKVSFIDAIKSDYDDDDVWWFLTKNGADVRLKIALLRFEFSCVSFFLRAKSRSFDGIFGKVKRHFGHTLNTNLAQCSA